MGAARTRAATGYARSQLTVTLEYVRRERRISIPYLGGRPAAVKPKYGRNAVRKGKGKGTAWASHVRDAELLGGSPAQAVRKPQRSRARERTAQSVDDPSADEQMEAVLREAAEVGGGEGLVVGGRYGELQSPSVSAVSFCKTGSARRTVA